MDQQKIVIIMAGVALLLSIVALVLNFIKPASSSDSGVVKTEGGSDAVKMLDERIVGIEKKVDEMSKSDVVNKLDERIVGIQKKIDEMLKSDAVKILDEKLAKENSSLRSDLVYVQNLVDANTKNDIEFNTKMNTYIDKILDSYPSKEKEDIKKILGYVDWKKS
jgi:ABC-type antimicrobial peptide transport system permease subunit